MTLGLIQLGLGGWGRSWVEEVTRQTPGIATLAWVDLDAASRATAIGELGLPPERVFGSLAAAMAGSAPRRRWSWCRWRRMRRRPRALEAGLHVLVEKPFTETLAEAAEPGSAGRRSRQRKLMVSQNYRWFPAPRLARELVAERAIGAAMGCYVDFHSCSTRATATSSWPSRCSATWRSTISTRMRFVLGDEPVEVGCQSWTEPASPFQGRPAAVATIRFARGTVVSYRGSWMSRGPTTPYGGNWRIDGTAGAVEFSYRGAGDARETSDRSCVHLPGNAARPRRACRPCR